MEFRRVIFRSDATMKLLRAAAAFGVAVAASSGPADAKGCIKGAIVGGIAGHMAGHGAVGAAAGCAVGHHSANKQSRQQQNQVPPTQPSR